jgi:two-component system, NarL family, sensor histidine kinase DevS
VSERLATERQLLAAQRELAVLDDRRRIARELHDRVIQRLFAAGLAASSVSGRLEDQLVRSRVEQVVSDLDEAITDLRSSIFQLAPPGAERSLRARVLDLCSTECDALDIRSNVRFSGPVDTVPSTRAEELLAVLREALSNVARHAHASNVDVEVEVTVDDGVGLLVADNGVGLSEPERRHLGQGFANMAARARSLGGSFAVHAGHDAGTRVEWRVPGP